jgi:hypothetical protein
LAGVCSFAQQRHNARGQISRVFSGSSDSEPRLQSNAVSASSLFRAAANESAQAGFDRQIAIRSHRDNIATCNMDHNHSSDGLLECHLKLYIY